MDIYIIDVNSSKNIDKNLLKNFQKRKFFNFKKQIIHSFSYYMTDKILSEVYKIDDKEIVFEGKKPYLKTRDKHFSISHCDEYIVLAFSDYECGVDIEKIKQRNFLPISKRMNFKSESLEDFYYNWTLYEAEYKLGKQVLNSERYKYNDYIITAVSASEKENFKLYIQNGNNFSNLKI